MAGENCENSCGSANVGLSQCAYKIPPMAGFIYVRKFDGDGVQNGIDVTTVFSQASLNTAINDQDTNKRFYPIMKTNGMALNGITPTPAEPASITTDYGSVQYVVPRAVVNWESTAFYVNKAWTERVRKLLSCGEWTAFYVDLNGYIHGILSDDGDTLYGYDIEGFYATFNWATATTLTNGSLRFTESISNDPEKAYYFSNITANVLGAKGLVDVNGTLGTPGATTITVTLKSDTYNVAGAPFEGLLETDFDVIKNSDGTNISIDTVEETSPGVYLITTIGSTGLSAHIEITKLGYDFSSVANIDYTYA